MSATYAVKIRKLWKLWKLWDERHVGADHLEDFSDGGEQAAPLLHVWRQTPQSDRCSFMHPADDQKGYPPIQCVCTARWYLKHVVTGAENFACTQHLGAVAELWRRSAAVAKSHVVTTTNIGHPHIPCDCGQTGHPVS